MIDNISIIIPFFNEEDNISNLVFNLNSFFSSQQKYSAEVIFVNDGSSDNSLKLLKEENHLHYTCKIISLSKNFGSHAALRAGIMHASGNLICFMYADLQDPLRLINELYYKSKEGNEICWATRNQTVNKISDKIFSRFYSSMMRKYAIFNYPKNGFDIVMFSSKVQKELNQNVESNSSIFLQILSLGFSQITIYYNKEQRKTGKSKWTLGKKIKLFIDSFVAFSYFPIRFVSIIGILFFIFGIMWTSYLVFRKIIFNDLESGWPALVSILMLGFGVTNISLGIIAEYLWRTLDSTRNRAVFIIDEILDIKNE